MASSWALGKWLDRLHEVRERWSAEKAGEWLPKCYVDFY